MPLYNPGQPKSIQGSLRTRPEGTHTHTHVVIAVRHAESDQRADMGGIWAVKVAGRLRQRIRYKLGPQHPNLYLIAKIGPPTALTMARYTVHELEP